MIKKEKKKRKRHGIWGHPLSLLVQGPRLVQTPDSRTLLHLPPPKLENKDSLTTCAKPPPGRRPHAPHPTPTGGPYTPPSDSTRPPSPRGEHLPLRAHEKSVPSPTHPWQETRDSLETWESYYQRIDTGPSRRKRNQDRHIRNNRIPKQGGRRNTESQKKRQRNPGYQKKPGRREDRNEGNSTRAMSMEGRPLMVSREDFDTKRWRDTSSSYRQTPRPPTSRTRRYCKNYRTHQPTILLA